MSQGKKVYIWALSIAGFIVIFAVMLVFVTCLTRTRRSKKDDETESTVCDLELGDLERERQRDEQARQRVREHNRGRWLKPMIRDKPNRDWDRDRYREMPHPDEFDLFVNPWRNRSLDSVSIPESVHMRDSNSHLSRGLAAEYYNYTEPQQELDLPGPDCFHMPTEDDESTFSDSGNPFADPTAPEAPLLAKPEPASVRALTSMGTHLRRWKARALHPGKKEEDEGETREITTPAATAEGSNLAALKAAAAAAKVVASKPYDPLPVWLITPKASAGPRVPRFIEVDIDGEGPVSAPDLDLIKAPIPERLVIERVMTWHTNVDTGTSPSRPVVVQRNRAVSF